MVNIIAVKSLDIPELLPYSVRNEPQLKHYNEPDEGLFIGESPEVILRAMDAGYEPVSFLVEDGLLETSAAPVLERAGDAPVYAAGYSLLNRITGYHLTKGILCAFRRKPLPPAEDLLKNARRVAIMEDLENPTNMGAVIRSAAALGMDAVLLTPGCSDPLYRRAIRVSVGTVFQIPWTYISTDQEDWPKNGMRILKGYGFQTAAMVLRKDSISIDDPKLRSCGKLAVMIGNEFFGIRPETADECDYMISIPMTHGVDSLNAAAASAVAFWELGKNGRHPAPE